MKKDKCENKFSKFVSQTAIDESVEIGQIGRRRHRLSFVAQVPQNAIVFVVVVQICKFSVRPDAKTLVTSRKLALWSSSFFNNDDEAAAVFADEAPCCCVYLRDLRFIGLAIEVTLLFTVDLIQNTMLYNARPLPLTKLRPPWLTPKNFVGWSLLCLQLWPFIDEALLLKTSKLSSSTVNDEFNELLVDDEAVEIDLDKL
uniref:Uncharacterized protein n=1 Tax=Romanomermis culicivorax TaxID=13658 RepID=A0A915HK27_ROMCU